MRAAWCLIALMPLLGGCWAFYSKDEGEKLRAEMRALQARVDELDQRDAVAKEQVEKLKSVLEQATSLVTRNSADVGLQVQKLQQDLEVLSGKVEGLSNGIEAMRQDY